MKIVLMFRFEDTWSTQYMISHSAEKKHH